VSHQSQERTESQESGHLSKTRCLRDREVLWGRSVLGRNVAARTHLSRNRLSWPHPVEITWTTPYNYLTGFPKRVVTLVHERFQWKQLRLSIIETWTACRTCKTGAVGRTLRHFTALAADASSPVTLTTKALLPRSSSCQIQFTLRSGRSWTCRKTLSGNWKQWPVNKKPLNRLKPIKRIKDLCVQTQSLWIKRKPSWTISLSKTFHRLWRLYRTQLHRPNGKASWWEDRASMASHPYKHRLQRLQVTTVSLVHGTAWSSAQEVWGWIWSAAARMQRKYSWKYNQF